MNTKLIRNIACFIELTFISLRFDTLSRRSAWTVSNQYTTIFYSLNEVIFWGGGGRENTADKLNF